MKTTPQIIQGKKDSGNPAIESCRKPRGKELQIVCGKAIDYKRESYIWKFTHSRELEGILTVMI